jgi:TRAP-type C4-dicarboxylate transport system permease small subunit
MATIVQLWKRFAETAAVVAFAIMFGAFVVQVASRYVFNSPVAWTLEVCLIAYVWVVFWSSDILVRERQHIVFDVLYNMVPAPQRRWLAVFVTASLLVVFALALPGVADYVGFVGRRRTTLLHIPMPYVFGAFLILMVAVVVNAAIRLYRLFRPGWRDEL